MSVVKGHFRQFSLDVHWVFEVWGPSHGEDVWVAPDPAQVGHVQEEAALTSSNHSLTVHSDASGSGKGQVWSLTQFYSVDFSKSRIGVKSAFSTNAQSMSASMSVIDGAQGPPGLARHT